MNIREMVGKLTIRTKPLRRTGQPSVFGHSESFMDCSYSNAPIYVKEVINGIIFIQPKINAKTEILSPIFDDDNWATFPVKYESEMWKGEVKVEV